MSYLSILKICRQCIVVVYNQTKIIYGRKILYFPVLGLSSQIRNMAGLLVFLGGCEIRKKLRQERIINESWKKKS